MIVIQVYRDRPSAIVNFLVVAFMGFGGALTSISRRANQIIAACPLDDDPIVESSAIQNGWWSLLVAALTGPIFAMILLVIFITHSFSLGEMTPRFVDCAKCTDYDFEIMNYKVCFLDYTDAAKTVFWSFLAGFAEQLVPDVLDRFTKASAKKG